jgi:hypothetical protein
VQHGDFTHIEVPADDPARARRFYAEIFGWTFADDIPGFEGYHLFTTPAGQEGMGGAIGKRGEMAPDRVRTYIDVKSIEDTLARITEQGGTLVEGKTEVSGMGWFAVFSDPEGNEMAIWESLQPD